MNVLLFIKISFWILIPITLFGWLGAIATFVYGWKAEDNSKLSKIAETCWGYIGMALFMSFLEAFMASYIW